MERLSGRPTDGLASLPVIAAVMIAAAMARPPVVSAQSCIDDGAPLRAELRRVHEVQQNVGLAVGVRRGDVVIFREDIGFADLEFEAPVDGSTEFGIASITKAFTGTLVLKLLEHGRF